MEILQVYSTTLADTPFEKNNFTCNFIKNIFTKSKRYYICVNKNTELKTFGLIKLLIEIM